MWLLFGGGKKRVAGKLIRGTSCPSSIVHGEKNKRSALQNEDVLKLFLALCSSSLFSSLILCGMFGIPWHGMNEFSWVGGGGVAGWKFMYCVGGVVGMVWCSTVVNYDTFVLHAVANL